jgi:hypothetical protein
MRNGNERAKLDERPNVVSNFRSTLSSMTTARLLVALGMASLVGGCALFQSPSGAPAKIDVSGGLPVSTCDQACLQQRAADQAAADAARAASAADAALVPDLMAKRAAAIAAIDKAIADFIHRRPPSVTLDEGSPTLVMLRSLQNMKTQIQNTPLGGMIPAYDEARGLLDRAYMHAVTIGMFDPGTVGQQNAGDTWWYISS